jgi:hydroxymethylpyrimidine/phosphomethylpyrimidine kinase
MTARPVILLIGGTDPSGGAGLTADVKTLSALGAHGSIAVTAITVQSTGKFSNWYPVERAQVVEQIKAVRDDGPVHAIKTGMTGEPETIRAISDVLAEMFADIPLVVDPLLSSGTGASLGSQGAAAALMKYLIPACTLCTPNLHEASILAGFEVTDRHGMEKAGEAIRRMGADSVLVKGGHLAGTPADVLVTKTGSVWYQGERIVAEEVHGTGCTLASAIAALLGAGYPLERAVPSALAYLRQGIRSCFRRRTGTQIGHFPPLGIPPCKNDDMSFYLAPRFCCRCGSGLSATEPATPHLTCLSCGTVHYRNPLPGVTVLLHDGERVLLVRRAKPPSEGELCLPGGFLETGETFEECGKRELLEETGLTAEEFELFGIETDTTAYGGVMLAVMEVSSWNGLPVPGDDASEVLWIDLDSVPDLAFKAHDRVVERLKERLSKT